MAAGRAAARAAEDEDGECVDGCGPDDFEEEHSWMDGPPPGMVGLPRGLRIRNAKGRARNLTGLASLDDPAAALPSISRRERWALGAGCAMCLLMTAHFWFRRVVPSSAEPWRQGCRQCRDDWWRDFWHWRLKQLTESEEDGNLQLEAPPEGMEWEWGDRTTDTDWFNASAELVNSVVLPHLDPSRSGPVLQIGCGDSPLPALLHQAGFRDALHIDVVPQVIQAMQERYPAASWPGVRFEQRDFLAARGGSGRGGPAPAAGNFSLVIDKAGIWDWLREEAPDALSLLLDRVHEALVPPPRQGLYVVATKQNPSEMAASLAELSFAAGGSSGSPFAVEATRPLGSSGIAWAYVLVAL